MSVARDKTHQDKVSEFLAPARRESRYKVADTNNLNCKIDWELSGQIETALAEPLELSDNGARFEVESPLKQNQNIQIGLTQQSVGLELTVDATVRSAEPTTNGRSIIGCEFTVPLPEDILPKLAATGELCRRQDTRLPILLYAHAKQELSDKAFGVRIEECSRGGLRFFSPDRVSLKDRVLLRFQHQNGYVSVVLNPRWQMGVAAGFFVGCSFVDAQGQDIISELASTPDKRPLIVDKITTFHPWVWGGLGAACMWFFMQLTRL